MSAPAPAERKPDWLRIRLRTGPDYNKVRRSMRELSLNTVCEEARCPNIFECWSDQTATFMILGEICTRRCGFCAVTTGLPHAAARHAAARCCPAAVVGSPVVAPPAQPVIGVLALLAGLGFTGLAAQVWLLGDGKEKDGKDADKAARRLFFFSLLYLFALFLELLVEHSLMIWFGA